MIALILALLTEPCVAARRDPCVPPATYTSEKSPVPYNAPVRYGGISASPKSYWLWIKDGEVRPCTGAESARYPKACAARVGDVLYQTAPFRVVSE